MLIVVALAAALVVAAYFILRPPPGSSDTPGLLLPFDPARAVSITVTRPGGRTEMVRRTDQPGDWVVVLPRPGGADEWPAGGSTIRGALRILSNLAPSRVADSAGTLGEGAVVVSVGVEDPSGVSNVSMSIDGRVLGGLVLARAEMPERGPLVWVDAQLADMLVRAGPREWRDARVLRDMAETSRITLTGPSGTISLARVMGRVYLREPIASEADPEAWIGLTRPLASVEVVDYLDAGPPEGTGLQAQCPVITLEQDVRDPQTGRAETRTTVLRVGQQADIAGKGVFAALTRPGAAERVLVVTAEPLARIASDPAAYIARRVLSVPAGDVASLAVGERRFTRTLRGWNRASPGPPAPAPPEDVQAIAALLKLLTETPAERVSLEPARTEQGLVVEAQGLSGELLASFDVEAAVDRGGPVTAVMLRSGRVLRVYTSREVIAMWPWLSGQ